MRPNVSAWQESHRLRRIGALEHAITCLVTKPHYIYSDMCPCHRAFDSAIRITLRHGGLLDCGAGSP